jgi:hypothetical protein
MLVVTYAFVGFVMGGVALIISLYVWLTMDEALKNGQAWMQLNRELKKKIDNLEKGGGASSLWKK